MPTVRLAPSLALLLAAPAALGATLPFSDGFEPPQTGFSNWTSTRLNGTNALTQSTAQAWDETQSLAFTYAGATANAQACAVVDFSAAITTPWVRFFLRIPPGTEAAMASGSTLRIVRLGDALSGAAGSGGAAKVSLVLRKDPGTGALHLRLDYANSGAGTTSLGTVLNARLTEGTWHYVELGYVPGASPRVALFIDDPSTARFDLPQSDTVAHSLLTAWIGLADAADPQTAAISLAFDNVVVGTAPVGTAQSISQHFNELESGTLTVASTPPGKAAAAFTTGGTSVSILASGAASHRGGFGMRVQDSDSQASSGNGAWQVARLTAAAPTLYRRFWWRPSGSNGNGARTIAQLTSTTFANRALAEVLVAGNGALSMGGYDAAAAYVTTTSASMASSNVWHLVELVLTGVGTSSGVRKLYVDGTLVAQAAGVDFTGLTVDSAIEGQPFSSNRVYQGTDDFDDLRASTDVMPSRLVVTAPTMTDGVCSQAVVVESRDSDGTPRPLPEPTAVTLTATAATGSFYSDPACTTVVSAASMPVGTNSFTVYFRPTAAGRTTLTAATIDLLPMPAVVDVASNATQLGYQTAPLTVAAGDCSPKVTVQAQTSAGAAASVAQATAVTLSSTSGTITFFSNVSCTTPVTQVTIAEGQSGTSFYFKDTAAGAPVVTSSAIGLTAGTQTETIIAAVPSKLVAITPARTAVAGVCSQVVTFQSQDTYGNPSNVAGSTPVNFNSSSVGGSFFSNASCTTAASSAPIAAGTNTVDIYFTDTRAGTPTLTAAAAGFLNGTQDQTVTPAAPSALAFSSAAQNVTAAACSNATVIEVRDQFGNPSAVSAATVVSLSSTPGSATFYTANDCSAGSQVSSISVAAAASSETFYFRSPVAGPLTINASSSPLTGASQLETISASGPTRLVITTPARSPQAGSCSVTSGAVTVQAQDSNGNSAVVVAPTTINLSANSGTLAFFGSGTCGTAVTSVTMAGGTDTVNLYFRDTVAGSVTITAAANGLAPATQVETIRAGTPTQLAFSTPARTGVAGECLGPITAQSRDGFGNPANVTSNTILGLTTTAPGGTGAFHSNAACTAAITQATIAATTNSVTFYYRDTKVGAPTLSASNAGLPPAPTQVATIGPAAPAKVVFTTAAQTLTAGNCSAVATVQVRDAFDNPSPLLTATQVSLLSSSNTFEFHSDSACSAAVNVATVAANGSATSFYFREPTAGAPTLTARITGLTDGTQAATINRGPAAKLAFVTPPRSPVAGTCSQALTVESQDVVGNAVNYAVATQVVVSTSSSTGGPYLDANCTQPAVQLSVPAGQARATFYFKDSVSGPRGVTATAPALTAASQTVTVVAGPAAFLVLRTPRQTIQAGTCSAVVRVDVEDALGNPAPASAVTTVGLTSSATTTRFFPNGTCTGAVSGIDLQPGDSTFTFHFSDTRVGTPQVTIARPAVPSVVQGETIFAGPPTHLGFTTPAQTVSVNTCSELAVVQVDDGVGNNAARGVDTVATLSTSSDAGTFFADRKCTSPLSSVTIPADGGAAGFYFLETLTGPVTLTASAAGLIDGAQQETIVTPGPATTLVFASAPVSQEALACSAEFALELKDGAGRSAPVQQATAISLSAMLPGASFHAGATCGAAVTQVQVPAGEYRAYFHYSDQVVHQQTLTASGAGLTSASTTVTTLCPAAVDGAPCDDTDLCNGRETCRSGACGAGTALDCDDGDVCTADSCAAATGCAHTVIAGCCRSPQIDAPNARAAVGVPYRIAPLGVVPLLKGTGPLHFATCDAPPAGFSVDATTGIVSWTPQSAGAAAICVEVTGACGKDTLRFNVTVDAAPPAPPVAAFTLTPSSTQVGVTVTADGSASTGTAPLSYEWSWGVGSALDTGVTATHSWPRAGSQVVQLWVYDAVGQRAQASRTIAISGQGCATPGTARIVASATSGDDSLSANFSCDCQGVSGTATYRWDFGDGATSFGATASHTFGPGSAQVRLQVSDGPCLLEDAVQIDVRQGGQTPPFCSFTAEPPFGPAPLTVTYAARFGSTTSTVQSARWSFSDGLEADAMLYDGRTSRTLTAPGMLEAELLVTDARGATCRATHQVTATSLEGSTPPRIESQPEPAAQCGQAWHYDDDDTPIATGTGPITWSLGKGAGGAGAPAGMSIDAATGALSWTPDTKTRGPVRVTLVASNQAGATEQDFLVTVECATQTCGCSSGGAGFAALALLLGGLFRRRRR